MNHVQMIILLFSLSIDLFFVGLSFGIDNINISTKQNIFLNLVGTFILIISVLIGENLYPYIKEWTTFNFSAWIFLLLGFSKILENMKKTVFQEKGKEQIDKKGLKNLLKIKTDKKTNQTITYKKLTFLAICFSVDNMTAGIGIGLLNIPLIPVAGITFFISFILFSLSIYLGNKLSIHLPNSQITDWSSGTILILIGLFNL